jgi:hypothetical protein
VHTPLAGSRAAPGVGMRATTDSVKARAGVCGDVSAPAPYDGFETVRVVDDGGRSNLSTAFLEQRARELTIRDTLPTVSVRYSTRRPAR